MFTQKDNNNQKKPLDSSLDSSLETMLLKLAQTRPPNLRASDEDRSCGNCRNFMYSAGRAWKGDGECAKYDNSPVKENFVCDDFDDVRR